MGPHEIRDGVYLSNGSDARRHGDDFDHVITLSRNGVQENVGDHEHTTQHIPLRDGKNSQVKFNRAVGATVKAIETHDGDVLVHCQAGVSRSSSVLIAALAHIDDTTFNEAYNEVWDAKPSIAPHHELRQLALTFLGEDDIPFTE